MMLHTFALRAYRAALLALLLLPMAGCEEGSTGDLTQDPLERIGAESLTFGLRSFLTTEGVRTGEVFADSAFEFPDSSFTRLYDMRMSLYHDDGRNRAHIESDSAILHTRTEELTAWGNVLARVVDTGMRVESELLQYDPTSQQIWSDSATVITQDDGSVTRGTAFRSDLTFENWSLENPVGTIPNELPGVDTTRAGRR